MPIRSALLLTWPGVVVLHSSSSEKWDWFNIQMFTFVTRIYSHGTRNWRNPILQTNFLSRIAFNIYKFIVKKKDRQNGATEWKVKGETCYGHRGKSPIRRDDKLRRGRCSCRHQIERSSLFSTILYIPLIFF